MHFCGTETFPCCFNKSMVLTTNSFINKHLNIKDMDSVTCKELVANRQAISIDMRSAEPAPIRLRPLHVLGCLTQQPSCCVSR